MNKGLLATILASALVAGTEAGDTQSLVKQLGSTHYPTREKASQALSGKTDKETTNLLLQAMKSGDLEASRRARMILKPYLDSEKEKTILGQMQKIREKLGGKFPWTDGNNVGWEAHQSYYAKANGASNPPDWTRYRHATELLILDLVKEGIDPSGMIEGLKESELRWIEQNGKSYQPPLSPTWK